MADENGSKPKRRTCMCGREDECGGHGRWAWAAVAAIVLGILLLARLVQGLRARLASPPPPVVESPANPR